MEVTILDYDVNLLKGAIGGIVRQYPIEVIIECLAESLNREVIRQIEPPNQPTLQECKELANKDKFVFRLYNALTGGF